MRPLTWALVQPVSAHYDIFDVAPPLGLLTLAAALEREGIDCSVCDLNLKNIRGELGVATEILSRSVEMILASNPDVVGITSMALESGFCLRLAELLKAAAPEILIVMGGPHFSAIADQALRHFSWIDYIMRGEAERSICALAKFLNGSRQKGSESVSSRIFSAEPHLGKADFDLIPFPAFEKISLDEYFETNSIRLANYESERGCIFNCSFCYSSKHWGRSTRTKPANLIQLELNKIVAKGFRHVFFVQDNFLNSRAQCLKTCAVLEGLKSELSWNCYATLPQLDRPIIEVMARAGCTEIFMGIDAVNTEQQRHFSKAFFRSLSRLTDTLNCMLDSGIRPTCAFLLDSPENDMHKSCRNAVDTALAVRMLGCGIRLNVLSLYPGTSLQQRMSARPRRYSELKPRLLFDTPAVNQTNEYAKRQPELFPFHSTHLDEESEFSLIATAHCTYTLLTAAPELVHEYCASLNCSAWDVSQQIAASIPNLLSCPALERRQVELSAFQKLIEAYAPAAELYQVNHQ